MKNNIDWHRTAMRHDRAYMAVLSAKVEELQTLITSLRTLVQSDEAVRCIRELDETLGEAVHDCALRYVRDLTAAGGEL